MYIFVDASEVIGFILSILELFYLLIGIYVFSYTKKETVIVLFFAFFSWVHANFILESGIEVYYGTVRGKLGQLV